MSTSAHQSELQDFRPTTDVCIHPDCTAEFPIREAIRGNYCSLDCHHRDKGRKALNQIQSDHRLCATCFRQLKTVERPPDEHSLFVEGPDHPGADPGPKDCLVGFQYPTEHMVRAVDVFGEGHRPLERTRWGCECGNVDPHHRDDILEGVDLAATIVNLYRCLRMLERDGAISKRPDRTRLFDTLREHGRDWELAVGRALYD